MGAETAGNFTTTDANGTTVAAISGENLKSITLAGKAADKALEVTTLTMSAQTKTDTEHREVDIATVGAVTIDSLVNVTKITGDTDANTLVLGNTTPVLSIDLGDGTDTLTLGATHSNATTVVLGNTAASADTITNFKVGTDKLNVAATEVGKTITTTAAKTDDFAADTLTTVSADKAVSAVDIGDDVLGSGKELEGKSLAAGHAVLAVKCTDGTNIYAVTGDNTTFDENDVVLIGTLMGDVTVTNATFVTE